MVSPRDYYKKTHNSNYDFNGITRRVTENMMDNLMKTANNIAEKYNGELSGEDLDINKIIRSVSRAFGQDENEMSKMIGENPMIQTLLKGGNAEDMMKGMNPDEVYNLMDDMKDIQEDQNELNDAFTRNYEIDVADEELDAGIKII